MALRTISSGTRPLVYSTHSASGSPASTAQPTALSSALCRPRSSQAKTISPLCSTKQLCTARVARYSGSPACMAAVRCSTHSGCNASPGTGRKGCNSTGLPSAILSVQQLATSCAAARRVGSGWRRYTCTFAPSAQTAICSTSSADAIHPSVSSRPKASCGSSAGVHTTRKAGCSFT